MPDSLNLTIQVSADEWSYIKRRVQYLEALLARALRERGESEWYSAEELVRLRLPGLPLTASGITRKAALGFWQRRRVRDRDGRQRVVFHVASLPGRTFDAIVGRILDTDGQPSEAGRPLPSLPAAPPIPAKLPDNAAPPWVLPLMRSMKTDANGDLAKAWASLPERLPPGCVMPSVEDAANVLVRFGVIRTGR